MEQNKMVTEYEKIKIDACGNSKEDVLAYIVTSIYDLDDIKVETLKLMKEDSKDKLITRFKKLIGYVTGYQYDLTLFDMDLEVLNEHISLICDFSLCNNKLLGILNEDNYEDVYRLAKFTHDKYLSNYQYLEEKRERIDCFSNGINYSNYSCCNDKDLFLEFFDDTFRSISSTKGVEKVKKM